MPFDGAQKVLLTSLPPLELFKQTFSGYIESSKEPRKDHRIAPQPRRLLGPLNEFGVDLDPANFLFSS